MQYLLNHIREFMQSDLFRTAVVVYVAGALVAWLWAVITSARRSKQFDDDEKEHKWHISVELLLAIFCTGVAVLIVFV